MNYVKAAKTDELLATGKKKVTLGDKVILLAKVGFDYYAVDNTCTHMGGSLYDGVLDGNQIKCPRHGSIYDVTNGKVAQRGTLLFIKVKVSDLTSYPVKVEGNDILIGIE